MKKQIISLLLILSFSVQSTYPSGLKKAKELLNIKANIRCLAKGDNCTKEKRVMLGTISALMVALAAAGVTAVVKSAGKTPTDEDMEDIYGKAKARLENVISVHFGDALAYLQNMARERGTDLKNVVYQGRSLISAALEGVRDSKKIRPAITQLKNEYKVEPTEQDKKKFKEVGSKYDLETRGWLSATLGVEVIPAAG